MSNEHTASALDAFVSEFDANEQATRAAADAKVAPRGFTVRRSDTRTTVVHNQSTRTFHFTRGSDSFRWSAPTGNFGDTHRNSGDRTFEFHDRVVVNNPSSENDPEVRAVAWFRAAEANGEAFSE